jgi:quinol monooxygenase YgiN
MTIEYIRYKLNAGQRDAFIESYKTAVNQLEASDYCKAYELSECEEESGSFILRIEWTSTEDHMNGFRKSTIFPAFFSQVKPFFDNILEMRHYKLTDVTRRK